MRSKLTAIISLAYGARSAATWKATPWPLEPPIMATNAPSACSAMMRREHQSSYLPGPRAIAVSP